jgi:hypothetical protein
MAPRIQEYDNEARERTMNDTQRNQVRDPSFHNAELVTTDASGQEKSYPLTLRDTSGTGLGAMYIGKEVLNPKSDYLIRGGGAGDRKVRIMWTKQVADFVLMLGMELAEG